MSKRSQPASKVARTTPESVARRGRRVRRAAALLATASLVALLCEMPEAAASDCADPAGAPPADIATPTKLYETLRARTNAELLAIGFLRKPVAEECAWIYEVKMLTASGSVVELDFAAGDLDLIGARGPDNDHDTAALVRGFGGDAAFLTTDSKSANANSGKPGGASGAGQGSGGGGNGDEGAAEGGSSGSGSGDSGSSGSGSGGSGSDGEGGGDGGHDGGGDGEGGEGGDD
ncbi:MAG: hypothetical protein ACREEP_20030 [Dongiaceae bacterium]